MSYDFVCLKLTHCVSHNILFFPYTIPYNESKMDLQFPSNLNVW